MPSTLTDTVAIVTGASSGIGEATAKALAHVPVGLLEPGAVDTELTSHTTTRFWT